MNNYYITVLITVYQTYPKVIFGSLWLGVRPFLILGVVWPRDPFPPKSTLGGTNKLLWTMPLCDSILL